MIESERAVAVPEQGNLVRVRDRFWVVESVKASSLAPDPLSSAGAIQHHRVRLVPIDDKGSADPLTVFWETEPGTEVRPQAALPDPPGGLDAADPPKLYDHLNPLIEAGTLEQTGPWR